MKTNLLSNAQLARLAVKARADVSMANLSLKCLPTELGTPVAEDFAESAIEELTAALAYAVRIKCQLRIRRVIDRRKGGAA